MLFGSRADRTPMLQITASGFSRRMPLLPNLTRPLQSIALGDLLITAAFAIVLVVQISHHEMWRDEIHSWGLVLASPSLQDLFGNLRFTGHPGLWYLLLWLSSWLTDSPFAVQIVHAAIGVLLIAAISLLSPFSRLEKLLLLSSYFVLFEYTVVSRNYGIGFLIALTYAHLRATRPDHVLLNGVLLGLLANTNLFALILSGALAVEYVATMLWRGGGTGGRPVRKLLAASFIYLGFVTLAVATMWPSPEISWRTTGSPLKHVFDLDRFLVVVAGTVESLIPLHPQNYWDATAEGMLHRASAAALPALALLFFQIFRGKPILLLVPGLTAAGSIVVGQLIYANAMRHWGVNFIAFVTALWIARAGGAERSSFATALLVVSAAAGIVVSAQQLPRAFSEGRATAEWIGDKGLADAALVGTPDTLAAVVAQYLGKPIHFLDCSCTDTFVRYHRRRDAFAESQIPDRLARALWEVEDRTVLFLVSDPLTGAELAALASRGIAAAKLAAFDHASTDESFYVYRVATAPAS
jgi:hypothetical protein